MRITSRWNTKRRAITWWRPSPNVSASSEECWRRRDAARGDGDGGGRRRVLLSVGCARGRQSVFVGLRSGRLLDRKSTRLNSSHTVISYAVFCLKKKNEESNNSCRRDHD